MKSLLQQIIDNANTQSTNETARNASISAANDPASTIYQSYVYPWLITPYATISSDLTAASGSVASEDSLSTEQKSQFASFFTDFSSSISTIATDISNLIVPLGDPTINETLIGTFQEKFAHMSAQLDNVVGFATYVNSLIPESSGGVIGDPIVVPVCGSIYSLPCDDQVYRYLSDTAGRVILNVRHELSDNITCAEIDSYCKSHPQARQFAQSLRTVGNNIKPYAFPRFVFLSVDGHEITIDLATLDPVIPKDASAKIDRATRIKRYVTAKSVHSMFKLDRSAQCMNGIECPRNDFKFYDNEAGQVLIVSVVTETYGMLRVKLFRFHNKQLRSGVSVEAEHGITRLNSMGAIVCPIAAKDCRVKKLHSLKCIKNTGRELKRTRMEFITSDGSRKVLMV